MIEIEFEAPEIGSCACCGKEEVLLTRFVFKDGDVHAVYYAKFIRGHEDQVVYGLISLGKWEESSSPEQRKAFPFVLWFDTNDLKLGLVNKEESPWKEVTILGDILGREEALKHPWIDDVFQLTDHIVTEDPQVMEYLNT